MFDLNEIAKRIKTQAMALGISKYDVFGRMHREAVVKVENGGPGPLSASETVGFTVRVWDAKGATGVASTSDVSSDGISSVLQMARDAARFVEFDELVDFSPEASGPLLRDSRMVELKDSPMDEMLTAMLKAEKELRTVHPSVTGVPYNMCGEAHNTRLYLNSEGSMRMEAFPSARLYLLPRAEKEGRKPRSGSAERMATSFRSLDLEGCTKEAGENLLAHLDYAKVPTGSALVVFSPQAILSLVGAFGNFVNARRILDKQSLTKPEMLGTEIASSLFALSDDVSHPGNVLEPVTFDGEGTPTRRVELIREGKLLGFLHTAATAKRMTCSPTGNASMGSKVTCGPNYLVIERGRPPQTERQLADETFAVYVEELEALHAGVSPLQGSFSLPFKGWMCEKGRRTSVEAGVVSGDFFTLLRSIVFVGKECEATPDGSAPEVWVENLAITGE